MNIQEYAAEVANQNSYISEFFKIKQEMVEKSRRYGKLLLFRILKDLFSL